MGRNGTDKHDLPAVEDRHGHWVRIKVWADRLNSGKMLVLLVLGIFFSGVLAIRAVNGYATKIDLAKHAGELSHTTADRLAKIEVNIDWIKESLKAMAIRDRVALPHDPE